MMFSWRQATVLCAAILLALGVAIPRDAMAQEPGDENRADEWASWWFGLYGGVNFNMFSGDYLISNENFVAPLSYDAGSGIGPTLGGVLEYNPGDLLGFHLLVGYDSRPVDFDDVTVTDEQANVTMTSLSTSLAYLAVEPSLRVNLGSRFFHALVGPTFNINVGKGQELTLNDATNGSTTASGDIEDVQSLVFGLQGGLGYDIPLAGPDANTQILLTPFAQFHVGLQDLIEIPEGSSSEFKVSSVRGGLQIKFGSRPVAADAPPPPPEMREYDFTVRAPMVVAESRTVNETFPLRNYIFFEDGQTNLPDRYVKLSRDNATNFREEQLLKPAAETGGSDAVKQRSRRQMEVYYNGLNVFGDRLRRDPSSSIKVVGSANGNAEKGKTMATNVKNYLVNTFGIDQSRIQVEGKAMPAHKSGSGSTRGDDKALVDAENNRVEIIGTPDDIMQPVNIVTVEEKPVGNDIVFTLTQKDNIKSWQIEVAKRGAPAKTFGPYNYQEHGSVVRIDARDILDASEREARYTTKMMFTTTDGETVTSPEKEFRLVRADPEDEQTGERYSILFEFDESKTVQTYETFLAETVAPSIPNGASVIIHGHTDVTGQPDYNAKLSTNRADEAQKILTRE